MGQDGVLCRSGWRGAHHVMRKAHCIWIPAWEYFLSSPSFAIKFIVSALRSVQTVSLFTYIKTNRSRRSLRVQFT